MGKAFQEMVCKSVEEYFQTDFDLEVAIPIGHPSKNHKFDCVSDDKRRKLTVTLAYLSPIHPSSIKYREKQVWLTINNGNTLNGSRTEYDYRVAQRGTLQHEIFENDSIEVIPYALFATFEMAPDCGQNVYQKIVDKIRAKKVVTKVRIKDSVEEMPN